MDMIIPEDIKFIIKKLNDNGFEAHPVGGCVRDMIMGIAPHDYDITTNAMPDETESVFTEYNLVTAGKKHGTIGVVTDIGVIEITTYRVDGDYRDSRHPENVSFTRNIEDDLARRDFTVNAIALGDGNLIDIFGGKEDIKGKIIRCVGEPQKRFEEDALRIMRGLRFASVLGFEIERNTGEAMKKCRGLLKNISAERIYNELCKLICGKNAEKVLIDYSDIICEIIPEFKVCIGFEQKNPYHCYDVYTHMVKAVSACPDDLYTRLAVLFHDIGKPDCFTVDENGTGHFYGHADISEKKTAVILERLKASNKEKMVIGQLVKFHDREIVCKSAAVKRFMQKCDEDVYSRIFDVKRADNAAQSPGVRYRVEEINKTEQLMEEIISHKQCFDVSQLAIGGRDIISLGVEPSRKIGEILNALLNEVVEGRLENTKEKLTGYVLDMINE